MPVVTDWPSYASTALSSAASTSPSTRRPPPESSIKRPRTSRLSRGRESRSSAFKKAMRERSSSSAAEYPSCWTEPSSVRLEQVPARLNKTLRLQRPLSLHLVTRHGPPMTRIVKPLLERRLDMKAARLHEYGKPLVLEDIPVPDIQPDEILVNVKACGMCRSDVQLVDGYFRKYADIPTPITLGHEITGIAHKIGGVVPKVAGIQEGDHVVVAPGWGDGVCRHCLVGNTHICPNVRWPGFGPVGGFAEFIPVPARYLVKANRRLKFEELAPLTDAGMTPFRGMKKLRDAG